MTFLEHAAAVVPTRGDVDIGPVISGLPFAQVAVWDNSVRVDFGVYGRYAAIEDTDAPVIFTQDDDVVVPRASVDALIDAYEPGMVVCNVPAAFRHRYTDSGLLGFGAVFDRDLPARAFAMFHDAQAADPDHWTLDGQLRFFRVCDIVFTMLTPMRMLDLPYQELPYATAETRMFMQPGHFEEREETRRRCREILAGDT